MHDTSVPNLSVWSGPAAPLCCLANKSQARQCSESLQSALEANLSGPGSMIYQTVWKPHTTPLGRQIYRLRSSARRTSDSEPSLVPSGWPTPTSRDHKDGKECPNVPLNALLGRVAWLTANPQAARITADGTMLTGCSAGMESGGQLNPAFSGWLQGFPEAWCRAALTAPLRKAPKRPGA